MVKCKRNHRPIQHLHIYILVLLVHAVHAANVHLFPAGSQVETFVAELYLTYGHGSVRLVRDRSIKSNGLLLGSDVIDNNLAVVKANTKHKTVWVELNRCDGVARRCLG